MGDTRFVFNEVVGDEVVSRPISEQEAAEHRRQGRGRQVSEVGAAQFTEQQRASRAQEEFGGTAGAARSFVEGAANAAFLGAPQIAIDASGGRFGS